jgi:hypothetical protein
MYRNRLKRIIIINLLFILTLPYKLKHLKEIRLHKFFPDLPVNYSLGLERAI